MISEATAKEAKGSEATVMEAKEGEAKVGMMVAALAAASPTRVMDGTEAKEE